jgi:asparagine synthase (glutamine-hydrolysing)
MCGIAGILGGRSKPSAYAATLRAMAAAVAHRGPDGEGVWVDAAAGVALGHRRLAVIDPSPAGDQPMFSVGGRFVIVFNGEIYNFRRLRVELEGEGYPFFGRSDTEVLLAAIDLWGVEIALQRIEGMFAFALWDQTLRELTLARDQVGKKPLYYGWFRGAFLFGSELRVLRAHPDFTGEIDREALGRYVRDGWYSGEHTVYRGVYRLQPGCYLRVRPDENEHADQVTYWSARDVAAAAARNPFAGSYDDAVAELEDLLDRAVRERLVADVPLGALLSGGIDSSTVVAMMAKASTRLVRTFSIGFTEPKYDEAPHARAVAQHLGTEHMELYVGPQEALALIPRLATIYDEPLGDHSQLPTCLLAELARGAVTVALSGDGGDELFLGYDYYARCLRYWQSMRRMPEGTGTLMGGFGAAMARLAWAVPGAAQHGAGRGWRKFARKLERRTRHLPARRPEELLRRSTSRAGGITGLVLGAEPKMDEPSRPGAWAELDDPVRAMAFANFADYLPEDILAKVDRASMAVGLEVRSPLLDRRLVEFAWSLPTPFLLGSGGGKCILRSVLVRHVPPALTERPKRGFSLPVDRWLRGPLQPWAEDLLAESALRRQGLLDPSPVRRIWRQHLAGWADHGDLLWALLMFQAWRHANKAATVS